jgi:hypothetical protein
MLVLSHVHRAFHSYSIALRCKSATSMPMMISPELGETDVLKSDAMGMPRFGEVLTE